jgi:acetyl-CoA synthetase
MVRTSARADASKAPAVNETASPHGAIYAGKPLVPPTPELVAQAPMDALEAARFLEAARRDPLAYWREIASELEWLAAWDRLFEGGFPDFRFFVGGLSNVALNCVDRHARSRPNQVAFFWEREDGARETWTYRQLYEAVGRFANALRHLGVGKGDRVALYMSNIPEAFVAVHACYRIGAIYGVIFAGFSAQAVHERLAYSAPKAVVVANASTRCGQVVPLKETLEKALEGVDSVEHVVVVPRMAGELAMGQRPRPPLSGPGRRPGDVMAVFNHVRSAGACRA